MKRLFSVRAFLVLGFLTLFAQGASAALSSGGSVSGALGLGQSDTHSFSGSAGDGVMLSAYSSAGTLKITIYQNGNYWTYFSGRRNLTLPSGGGYSAEVEFVDPNTTGTYELHFVRGGGSVENGSLSSGSTAIGNLSLHDIDSYTFSGDAGDGVIFSGTGDSTVQYWVYTPDGKYWTYFNTRRFLTLPANGTYTIVPMFSSLGASGTYNLHYVRGGSGIENSSLSSGNSVTNLLLTPADIDSYTFSGNQGDGIILDGYSALGTIKFYVFTPDGKYWTYFNTRRFLTLPATGTYTLVPMYTSLSAIGAYDVHFVRGGAGVENGSIASGSTTSGILGPTEFDSYTFSGNQGEGIILGGTGTGTVRYYVFTPNGKYWTYFNTRRFLTLPATGTYTVVPMFSSLSVAGTYDIQYVKGADSIENSALTQNGNYSDSLSAADFDSFTVTGNETDVFELSGSGAGTVRFYVFGPQGNYWTYFNGAKSLTMYEDGTYTIIPMYSSLTASGGYNFDFTFTDNTSDGSDPEDEAQNACYSDSDASKLAGNPINFAQGFKVQTESDFSNGVLKLSRIYRSNATWISDNFGSLWHSSYYRSLTVSGNAAAVVDDRGTVVDFTKSGSNWVLQDTEYPAQLADVLDGSTHVGYVFTTAADTREYFDLNGKLTRIEYRGGEAVDVAYDSNDRLSTVTDENGDNLSFTYNTNDQVETVVTSTGTFTYGYDSNSNLTSVTKPDGESRTYHYEDTNHVNALTGITDEKGVRYATYAYDSEGRAISSEHIGGVNSYAISYNSDDTVTTTNPLGKQTTYTFETIQGVRKVVAVDGHQSANCAAANKAYTYDSNGFMLSKTDWLGNVTSYVRDSRGLVTSMTEDVNGSSPRTTSYTYDPVFRLKDVVTEVGKTTDYDYDAQGRMTSVTVTDTATSENRVTAYSYHADTTDSSGNTILGKVASVNGPRNDVSDVTSYVYDGQGRLIKTTNALGHETETTSFDSADRPLTTEDENNVVTTMTYDAMGRLLTSSKAGATTSYTYDDNGNVLTITQPNGVVVAYGYDDATRMNSVSDAMGNSVTYTHDAAGNIASQSYKDSGGTLRFTQSQLYDELSRLIETVDANNDAVTNAYDVNGNQTEVRDGNLNATTYAFDGLNRLVSETDALSGVTTNGLNSRDELTSVTDPRSNTTSYTYNAFGDVLSEVSPDRGTVSYTYDAGGNMLTRADARGETVTYTYDALNRVTSANYASDSSLDQSFTYESCSNGVGRLCSVSDAGGSVNYTYDVQGRLTAVTETRGSLSFTTNYSYDAAGVLTAISLPSGRNINYVLNGNAQVQSVDVDVNGSSTTIANGITYLPFGGIESLNFGNGVSLTNSYNTAYQLTAKQHGSLFYDSYSYDNAGNITSNGSDSYSYDALYRLIGENSDSYTYDAIANRLSDPLNSYNYPSSSSRLSSISGSSISTDAAGNITQDVSRSYVINAAGHVEGITIGGSLAATYTYDANNQRVKKVIAPDVTHYVYGAGGLLYGEYDAAGNVIREYVYLNGEPIAQIDGGPLPSGEALAYLHTDHLGTPRVASNDSGVSVWSWDSDAFGNGTPGGSATVNLRFAGQYWDDESGLHYNWNRYYDPQTGRYISSDPIGLDGGLNTFAYVSANPVMFTDPEGLKSKDYNGEENTGEELPKGSGAGYNCAGDALCNKGAVVENFGDILRFTSCFTPLLSNAPNRVGDIVYYPGGHVGTVVEVDAEGNTIRVRSKSGTDDVIVYHHPKSPAATSEYGQPIYFRPTGSPYCCYIGIDFPEKISWPFPSLSICCTPTP